MANISSATVRVKLWSDLGEQIPFNFESLKGTKTYDRLVEAFDQISYDVRVDELSKDIFLGGRWLFSANLEWTDEVSELYQAFVEVNPNTMTVELDVFDCDESNDWWETYKVLITEGGKVEITNLTQGTIDVLLERHKAYLTQYDLEDEDDNWSAITSACIVEAEKFFASI